MPKIDPSAALAILRASQREQKAIEPQMEVVKHDTSDRRAAWAAATELSKESLGSHVLMDKVGKGSRPIIATSLKENGLRMVLIPYTETEMRTARRVGLFPVKDGGLRVRGNFHEQWVRPERVKKAA